MFLLHHQITVDFWLSLNVIFLFIIPQQIRCESTKNKRKWGISLMILWLARIFLLFYWLKESHHLKSCKFSLLGCQSKNTENENDFTDFHPHFVITTLSFFSFFMFNSYKKKLQNFSQLIMAATQDKDYCMKRIVLLMIIALSPPEKSTVKKLNERRKVS